MVNNNDGILKINYKNMFFFHIHHIESKKATVLKLKHAGVLGLRYNQNNHTIPYTNLTFISN